MVASERNLHPVATPRLYFVANGIYCDDISGGDSHFFEMAKAAIKAGHRVHFLGGHALKRQLEKRFSTYELILTDKLQLPPFNAGSLRGQFRLLADYYGRFR